MSFLVLNEDICPLLTSDILDKLSQIKIISVCDLLLCDLSKIRSISRKKEIDFKTLLDIKSQLYQRFGPKKLNAFLSVPKGIGIKTGIEKFDEMVRNGIRKGEVTEIYGYPNSGKSQFCYTLAVNLITKYNKKVVFIDTDVGFSAIRLREISGLKTISSSDEDMMSNLKVITILDMFSLLDTIESISNDLKTNSESEYKDLSLIIIDSLSTPLSLELKRNLMLAEVQEKERCNPYKASELRFKFVALVSQIASTLNSLASEHSLAVVVVNSQFLSLKNNWKNFCKLSLNFYDCETQTENNFKNTDFKTFTHFKGIKIMRTYDKNIENKCYEQFMITLSGFTDEKQSVNFK